MITVRKAGGLAAGEHKVEFEVRMRVSCLPFVPTTNGSATLQLAAERFNLPSRALNARIMCID